MLEVAFVVARSTHVKVEAYGFALPVWSAPKLGDKETKVTFFHLP